MTAGRRARTAGGRLLAAAVLLVAVSCLPWLARVDPARAVYAARTGQQDPTPAQVEAVREELGLAAGPVAHLWSWTSGLVRGDAGTSWVSGAPVRPVVLNALGVSTTMMLGAFVVTVAVAALLTARPLWHGVRGSGRRSRAGALTAALAALPKFTLAAVLATVAGVWLGWFPSHGWTGPSSMVLPALALGVPTGAVIGGLLEQALAPVLAEPWVRTRRAFGLSDAGLATSAVRRAVAVVLPQVVPSVVALVGGAVAVEQVFNIPGLGRVGLDAALARDLPVLQAAVLALLGVGVLAGLLVRTARALVLGPALRDGGMPAVRWARQEQPRALTVLAVGSALVLAVVVGAGLTRDPLHVDPALRLLAPGPGHPLGTDALGRDLLARIGHGAWRTVTMALVVTVVSMVVGTLVGLSVRVGAGVADVLATLPVALAGLLTVAATGPSSFAAMLAVSLVAWVPYAAQTAAVVEQERGSGHVLAARALGVRPGRIVRAHVLPAVLPAVVRNGLLRLPTTILALAGLGFLGLGEGPPAPEWGRLLSENQPYAELAPWGVLAPAGALVLLSVAALGGTLPSPRRSLAGGLGSGRGRGPGSRLGQGRTPDAVPADQVL